LGYALTGENVSARIVGPPQSVSCLPWSKRVMIFRNIVPTVRDKDHGRVTMTIAVALHGLDQGLDFRWREVFTGSKLRIRFSPFGVFGHTLANCLLFDGCRPGLRVSELCDLQWNQIDFQSAAIHIRRVKRGTPATHPLTGNELRDLRKLKRENDSSPFVFVSELGTPFTTRGFSQMLKRAAEKAGLDIKVHAHMLRHACGFKLANDGVDTRSLQSYLGHKNIQHTVRYTELSPNRFKDFWKD